MSPRVFKEGKFVFWFHAMMFCMKVEPEFMLVQVRKTMQVTLKSGWSRRSKSAGPGVH
jgi:hypothetical protein